MISALAIASSAASALGSYNLAAWAAKRAIKRRRQVKAFRGLVGDVRTGIGFIRTVRDAVSDGIDDTERAKIAATAKAIRELLDGEKPVAAGKAAKVE
jgi:hypothetical protein